MALTIPAPLKAHLGSGTLTICLFTRIVPVDTAYPEIGLTNLDKDIEADTGNGTLIYNAATGVDHSAFVSSSTKEVDTSGVEGILGSPEFDLPITEDDVERGIYDHALYEVYLGNYEDLGMGFALIDSGTLGRMKMIDGTIFFGEMRSWIDKLKTSIIRRGDVLCPKRFGSQIGEERHPCTVDVAPLWKAFTIDVVDADEPDRIFKALGTGVAQPDGKYIRGMVKFLTGLNAGRSYEIETNEADGTTYLRFPTRNPIINTDTGQIRIGCRKRFIEDCKTIHNNHLNFGGFPHMSVGDLDALSVPGANPGNNVPGNGNDIHAINGDFELGDTGWTVRPTGMLGTWSIINDAAKAPGGNWCGKFEINVALTDAPGSYGSMIENDLVVTNGRNFKVIGKFAADPVPLDAYIYARIFVELINDRDEVYSTALSDSIVFRAGDPAGNRNVNFAVYGQTLVTVMATGKIGVVFSSAGTGTGTATVYADDFDIVFEGDARYNDGDVDDAADPV